MASINLQAGQIIEVRLYAQATGQTAVNTLHFTIVSVQSATTTGIELADSFDHLLNVSYKHILNENAFYPGLTVRRITAGFETPAYPFVTNSGFGDTAGDLMPGQVAGLVSIRSDRPGRSGRGRIFLPFPGEADNGEGGTPSADYITRATSFFDNANGAAALTTASGKATVTVDLEIYKRAGQLMTPISGAVVRTFWATQRRRSFINRGDANPL